jgi:hypothetical protein
MFVDEYLLPKLDAHAQNGWPDSAVLWPDRVWIIEFKTEAASHRTTSSGTTCSWRPLPIRSASRT